MRNSIIKNLCIAILCGVSYTLFSQNVAINRSGNGAYASAILDLSNNNIAGTVGFLPPYVTLTSLSTFGLSGVPAQSNGIIVYNTGGSVPAGLYYWDNTTPTWVPMGGGSLSGSGTTNYLARWTTTTTLGIGVAQDNGTKVGISATAITPKSLLDVNGGVSIGTYAGNNAAPANGMIISGQVGIGNNAPASSAIIDFTNTKATGATGEPLLWCTNPNPSANIVAPVLGEEIYNTTTGCFDFYNGTAWLIESCPCNAAPTTPTVSATCSQSFQGSSITYSSSVTSGVAFNWTATATTGTPTLSANGLSSITVTWPSGGAGTGTLGLTLTNACGTATVTQTVTINNPAITGTTPIFISSTGNTFNCSASGATYSWSSNNTNEGVIVGSTTTQSVSVTAGGSAGTFTLTCNVSYGACNQTLTYPVSVTCATGSDTFAYANSIQTWTVPTCTTTITIIATGAAGATSSDAGGKGAVVTATVTVVGGHVLDIVTGQKGKNTSDYGAGGGGGTFVWDNASTTNPLVVAGGGGGGGNGDAGADASTTTTPTNDAAGKNGAGGAGGTAGAEGSTTSNGAGGGGTGWTTVTGNPAAAGTYTGGGGVGEPSGFTGGASATDIGGSDGGYGGGGGGGDNTTSTYGAGGGGGGYNGGGGGNAPNNTNQFGGGGGGSGYYNGTTFVNPVTVTQTGTGNGKVIIMY